MTFVWGFLVPRQRKPPARLSMDSNSGAMFRHQAEPRAGGQPEGSDGDPRGEAESMSRNHIRVPNVMFQGGAWQREAYTYNDPQNEGCLQNILYKDRVKKIIKQMHVDYCLQENSTLDEHDITHFFATSADGKSIAVGSYEDGSITATHAIPDGMMVHDRAFSWDLNRGIVTLVSAIDCGPDAECAAGQPQPEAIYWNLSTGEWREVAIPQYTTPVDPTASRFQYNHDKDSFEYLARLLVGKTYTESAATVDKVTDVK